MKFYKHKNSHLKAVKNNQKVETGREATIQMMNYNRRHL